jgi:hypothetical protein
MARPHQIRASVFPRADQVPGGLLSLGRHPHLGELPDVQQPSQAFGVAAVGLDPVPWRAFQFGRRHHHTSHPGRLECPGQSEPGRTSLIGTATGPGSEPTQLTTACVAAGSRCDHSWPVAASSTPATTDRACTSKPTAVRSHTIRRLP